MAVRYATIYPHSQFLYCTIIQEFGKKNDLGSTLKAFKEIKKSQDSINMFMYHSIIDVCVLCGNPLKSRDIFKIHYNLVGKDGLFSHKEITVLFLPNLSEYLPSLESWKVQLLARKKRGNCQRKTVII